MTIKELYYSENFTIRCFNICLDNDLNSLSDILKHFQKYKTFQNLRNCGIKTNLELITLSEKYLQKKSSLEYEPSFSLTEPQIQELNVIISSNFEKLNKINQNSIKRILKGDLDFYNFKSNLIDNDKLKVRNADISLSKDKKEINHLVNIVSESFSRIIEVQYNNDDLSDVGIPLISVVENLNRNQREIVNNFIEINSNNLSNRSKNAITHFLNNNLKIRNISETILTNAKFKFQDIKNIGSKSFQELQIFFDSITDIIIKVSHLKNESDLVSLKNRFFIEKTFPTFTIPDEILESKSIFILVNFLIRINAIFDRNVNIIFQKAYKIYIHQPIQTLDEIAFEINITRERVRQIRKNIIDNLFNRLSFIRNIEDDLYQKYNIDKNQNLINVEDHLNNLINETNNTNFSNEFNTFIIYSYFSDSFDIVGEIEDVLLSKYFNSRERHNWKNLYLVNKNLSNKFDFSNFVNNISNRIQERNEEDYSFNFTGYLNNFTTLKDNSVISKVFPIAEKIVNQEFDLFIDLDENITFKRKTLKQVSEYAIDALGELGIPSKLEEIYRLIERDFPEATKNSSALRGSLQKSPEIIYFGRSSLYGLKKWEIEKDGIKGGTMKDIIIDFIKDKKHPLHVSLIIEHLRKYRGDRDERSIITNLKVDPHNRFIVFSQSFIGLRENIKFYSEKYNKLPVQLGKTIIAKHKKGVSKSEINNFLQSNFDLTFDESNLVINNLQYFNEN